MDFFLSAAQYVQSGDKKTVLMLLPRWVVWRETISRRSIGGGSYFLKKKNVKDLVLSVQCCGILLLGILDRQFTRQHRVRLGYEKKGGREFNLKEGFLFSLSFFFLYKPFLFFSSLFYSS